MFHGAIASQQISAASNSDDPIDTILPKTEMQKSRIPRWAFKVITWLPVIAGSFTMIGECASVFWLHSPFRDSPGPLQPTLGALTLVAYARLAVGASLLLVLFPIVRGSDRFQSATENLLKEARHNKWHLRDHVPSEENLPAI